MNDVYKNQDELIIYQIEVMKKKFILFFSVACLAVMTAVNTQLVFNQDSPFSLEQVEALASGEYLPEVPVICDRQGWGKCYITEGSSALDYCCEWDGSPVVACAWDPC